MTPLDGWLALLGILAVLFVPWLLVAKLPRSGPGAEPDEGTVGPKNRLPR